MKPKILVILWLIGLSLWVSTRPVGAQNPSFLTLRLSQPKSYYKQSEQFTVSMSMTNSLSTAVRAGVVFELRARSGLSGNMDTPVIYRKAWPRYKFSPGASELKISKAVSSLRLAEGAYPIKVSLVQEGQEINSARSMLVVLEDHPQQEVFPVALVAVWPLHDRARFDFRGAYQDNKIAEDSNSDPGSPGLYQRHLSALFQYPNVRVTLAVTPLLVEQMVDMKDGYRLSVDGRLESVSGGSKQAKDISAVHESLASLFGSRQVSLLPVPYSLASLSFLADNGWDEDSRMQISKGRSTLTDAFELSSPGENFGLPNFALSINSISHLAEEGVHNTIIDEGYFGKLLPGSEDDIFQSYRLQDGEGNRITAFFRDSQTSQALGVEASDEAVQKLVGRLAEVYLYQPQRQKVVVAAADISAAPSRELLQNLYSALQAPWIETVSLNEAVELAPPASRPVMMLDIPAEEGYLSAEYRKRLSESRRLYRLFSGGVASSNPIKKRLGRELLITEGWDWTRAWDLKTVNLGLGFVQDIEKTVRAELSKIKVVPGENITLSSLRGKIPIAIFSRTGYPVEAEITLDGKYFSFPSGRTRRLTIGPKENLLSFDVAAARPGSFLLKVKVSRGPEVIDEQTFAVKATSLVRTISLVLAGVAGAVVLYFFLRYAIRAKKRAVAQE